MSIHYPATEFAQIADRIELPNIRQDVDRTFELPTGLYVATVGLYFAFLAMMAIGFQTREMIVPMGVFIAYIVMAFGVPSVWARMRPENDSKAIDWFRFREQGIVTMTGPTSAKDATAQVLILPVLILFWGIGTAMIAGIVS
jgi:hypothetical protein